VFCKRKEEEVGAVFFMMFVAVVFFIALFFIGVSALVVAIWNMQKRRNKSPKKWWLVISSVVLGISIIVALLPIGGIGFLRFANSSTKEPVIYAESGEMLYWPMGEHETTHAWFEMNGIKYADLSRASADDPFLFYFEDFVFGEPVANIMNSPEASNAFNDFMTWLLAGSTPAKLSISTVFPLMNNNGFDLYYVNRAVYCPEGELDPIREYYLDIAHYETQSVTAKYRVYADAENPEARIEKIEKETTLEPGIFEEVHRLYDRQDMERIMIPEKYKKLREAAVPGTSSDGYDGRLLYAYSEDGMAYKTVVLALIEGKVYVVKWSNVEYIEGCVLSDELNEYLIDAIFTD
jgi:succinate dehydrogenase/fumarate reductase cytochrome b subunit